MEQIVVKTEVQPNGDILLFYVDESNNGVGQGTSSEPVHQPYLQDEMLLDGNKYVIEDIDEISNEVQDIPLASTYSSADAWSEDDIKKLLIFFVDNKEAFLNGPTQRRHLWMVACKTMLHGKNHTLCEQKLKSLMQTYIEMLAEKQKGVNVTWPLFNVCHEAFHDVYTNQTFSLEQEKPPDVKTFENGLMFVKKQSFTHQIDEKVLTMLNLYLKHRTKFQKDESQRGLWELITLQLGEQDVDFWHRRFLNYKQHYVRLLHKQKESGPQNINWPYMDVFNQIYKNDEEFLRKYSIILDDNTKKEENHEDLDEVDIADADSWMDMQKTFLAKYCYDCFNEFQDTTIPNDFLWSEVGRLLGKEPEDCKDQYSMLKKAHFKELIDGGYDIANRNPLAIILDNIISKETKIELEKPPKRLDTQVLKDDKVDELVQYFYDNIEMLKDSVCQDVCFAAVAKKLKRNVQVCKKQWNDLTALYKSILNDKKENPELQIDWKYIDLFDRMFGYGMDIDLLDSHEKVKTQNQSSEKIGVKKVTINNPDKHDVDFGTDDDDIYDERGFTKHSKKQAGEAKAYKILEFYLKHKYKFSSPQYKRVALWETLSKQIGIPATECAHRFRNFKQVYKGYVKRELSKPEKPILWPYYPLCKKVFGYRSIKSKLKNEIKEESHDEDWAPKDIKSLISYFARNYEELKDNAGDRSKWVPVAADIGRSDNACKDKFLELRKSYRKLKTMKTRKSDVKVSWKYFNMMDEIYSSDGAVNLEDIMEDAIDDEEQAIYAEEDIKNELQDEDYTIIVIPEGEEMPDMKDVKLIYENDESQEFTDYSNDQQNEDSQDSKTIKEETTKKPLPKWTKRSKNRLLILYLNYLRANKGKVIKPNNMWTEIATKFGDRKPQTCRKMFVKLRNQYKESSTADDTAATSPYSNLFSKILSLKAKFARKKKSGEGKTYKDYPLDDAKVELALKYYLQNIEEFTSPKFEKKYLWTELANYIGEPVTQMYNKVNYLIQFYKSNTLEAENTRFGEVLKEIFIKENLLNDVPSEPKPVEEEVESTWTDEETETLLTWYLAHLEKFKNPKFVRSYLWMEASDILKKSPWACSNKMSEIRTQYRTMVKENIEGLNTWRFYSLCQRIYGTGKKNNAPSVS